MHVADDPTALTGWSLRTSLLVLGAATAVTALIAEILVGSIDEFAANVGLSEFFVAAVIVAIVGNAAEHGGAVVVAARGNIKLAAEIALASSAQVAVFLIPAVALALVADRPARALVPAGRDRRARDLDRGDRGAARGRAVEPCEGHCSDRCVRRCRDRVLPRGRQVGWPDEHQRHRRARERPDAHLRRGRNRRPRAAGSLARHPEGRPDRDHGAVGLGQVDADAHPRGPRQADGRRGRDRRHADHASRRLRPDEAPTGAHRLRLPVLQPPADAHGRGEHPAAAHDRGREARP